MQEIRSEIAAPVQSRKMSLRAPDLSSLASHYFTDQQQSIPQVIVSMLACHLAGLVQIVRLTYAARRLRGEVLY